MRPKTLPLPFPRVEVRLAGSGGQGLLLAGLILAEAAGVYEGREVAMAQSYGPEARGGASKAEVIISESPIDYPLCSHVDVFLAMTQEAADAYCWDLKPGAWILVDQDLVTHPPSSLSIGFPFTAAARDKLQRIMVANIIALAAIAETTGIVSRRSLEKAVLARVPRGTEDLNKKALNLGIRLARDRMGMAPPEEEKPQAEDM